MEHPQVSGRAFDMVLTDPPYGDMMRRPQSGEHFIGRANIMAMYHQVPGPPQISWQSIRGGPAVWVAQGIVEYGEGPAHIIGVLEFADGKMVKGDYYFADPFEPPEYRARWASQAPT